MEMQKHGSALMGKGDEIGMKKKIVLLVLLLMIPLLLTGCMEQEADKVTRNLSLQADNFNVTRRVTVYNCRTDKILLEVVGNLSVQKSGGDVDLIIEVAPGQYKKHFVRLNDWTMYVVEDVSGAFADKYHYTINFLPDSIMPIRFTNSID
jgi:hypothetical protein